MFQALVWLNNIEAHAIFAIQGNKLNACTKLSIINCCHALIYDSDWSVIAIGSSTHLWLINKTL